MAQVMAKQDSPAISVARDGTAAASARQTERAALRQDDFDRDVWCLLGIPVDISDIDSAAGEILSAVRERKRLSFVTPNVNWLVRSLRNETARREMLEADLSLVDGAPLAFLARRLGIPVKSRIAGSDLFEFLRRRPAFGGDPLKVFFFGGRDGSAEAAARRLDEGQGGLAAAGYLNPGFGDVDSMSGEDIINTINASAPDFIVVSLGAGKGQTWISRNQEKLNAPVIAHLGAVVDFTAGNIARAPLWMRKTGLEWLWRIIAEPSLWRRYLDDGIALSFIVATRMIGQLGGAKTVSNEAKGSAVIETTSGAAVIKLSGELGRANLRSVRDVFRKASSYGGDVVLDFRDLSAFDRAFLGLVLLLEKNIAKSGGGLFVDGASKAHLRVLRANEMNYPASPYALKTPREHEKTKAAAM